MTGAVVDSIFENMVNNLEFMGIDFKQFFLLMTGIDWIYIYGQENNGSLTQAEWQKLMADNQLRADLLDNIDDCYVDRLEEEEKNPVTDHWLR